MLDIGCGPGTITVDLAARVAPGSVTAVEITDEALNLARAEAQRRSAANVSFATADVHALDFPDDAFDVVHAHQVLQHVADPVQALREMRRVCVPGGIVAVRDADYAGLHLVSRGLRRWTVGWSCTSGPRAPMAANRMRGGACCRGRGRPASSTSRRRGSMWCYATDETRDWWGGMWADRILHSDLARQLVNSGLATSAELEEISAAWREWAAAPDGWLAIPNGEILCRA